MKVFLTGASGFVGSHVLRHLLMNTDAEVVCPVTFRHKGIPPRVLTATSSVPDGLKRTKVILHDLQSPIDKVTESFIGPIDVIMNVASLSHVDDSITDPGRFLLSNTGIMVNVLEYARRVKPYMLLQMSTDEVYGPAYGGHRHREWETLAPSNPYSGSKAAQEAACFSYWRTYGVPVVITNTMNVFGETQDPEKMFPKSMRAIRDHKPVTVHVDTDGRPGSRFYLHAQNLANAWMYLATTHLPQMYPEHTVPSRFNIVGEREVDNIELVGLIADAMGEKDFVIDPVNFHMSRPGHDLRYALDGAKLASLGWAAPYSLESSLKQTVHWTLEHPEWLL